jgi:hypothetical protein
MMLLINAAILGGGDLNTSPGLIHSLMEILQGLTMPPEASTEQQAVLNNVLHIIGCFVKIPGSRRKHYRIQFSA